MSVLIEADAFTVDYDPAEVSIEQILAKVRELGYEPRRGDASALAGDGGGATKGPIPEPVAGALAEANQAGELLLVDFHADWCGPCERLEREVLSTHAFRKATQGIRLLKVDTDRYPEVARYFRVVGLPTLVALEAEYGEILRLTGSIGAEELVRKLTALRERAART